MKVYLPPPCPPHLVTLWHDAPSGILHLVHRHLTCFRVHYYRCYQDEISWQAGTTVHREDDSGTVLCTVRDRLSQRDLHLKYRRNQPCCVYTCNSYGTMNGQPSGERPRLKTEDTNDDKDRKMENIMAANISTLKSIEFAFCFQRLRKTSQFSSRNKRTEVLRVSDIIYSHLLGPPLYTRKYIHNI